jgi:acetoacetyl-CoA synthetase
MFQGNPFKPNSYLSMPKLIEQLKITQFGTSAKYLSRLEQNNCYPLKSGIDLSSLRAIYSTGSPLAPSTFKYVYDAFPSTINLGSITGGTDIISLFGAPSPISPVYQGEIQVKGLGMDICAVDNKGKVLPDGESGDLVCLKPFPCQPVGFLAADDDDKSHIEEYTGHKGLVIKYNKKKYGGSYFEKVPGAWHHGDFVHFNPNTGGLVMLGRSDGVLNRSGVRFGSESLLLPPFCCNS